MKTPRISVIIPAYNASATLRKTIASVQAQEFHDWQVIVVDDGSTDVTRSVAGDIAARDKRIVCLSQNNSGASAARNAAIVKAQGEWIHFLDSDDIIAGGYFTKMLAAAEKQQADIVICEHEVINGSKKISYLTKSSKLPGDHLKELMKWQYFAVHSALTKRDCVLRAGMFDTSLRTCEDWDFWLKIFAQNARIGVVNEVLAYYCNTPRSLCKNAASIFADVYEIRRRQKNCYYGKSIARYNLNEDEIKVAHTQKLFWCVGIDAVQGRDSTAILKLLDDITSPDQPDTWLLDCLFKGMNFGSCLGTHEMAMVFYKAMPIIEKFFMLVEERLQRPGLSDELMRDLYSKVFVQTGLDGALTYKNKAYARLVDLLRNPVLPGDIDSLTIYTRRGYPVPHLYNLPVRMPISRRELLRLVAFEYGERLTHTESRRPPIVLMKRGWKYCVKVKRGIMRRLCPGNYDHDPLQRAYLLKSVHELILRIEKNIPAIRPGISTGQTKNETYDYSLDAVWEQIFKNEDPWDYNNPYEQEKYRQTLSLLPDMQLSNALELACAEGHFTVNLADYVGDLLATDISETAVQRAAQRCMGKPNVHFAVLDMVNQPISGQYDLIVASEVLYFMHDNHQRRLVADKIAGALKPGGYFLSAHARLITDDSDRTAFDWGDTIGVRTIMAVLNDTGAFTPVKQLSSDLYEIHLLQKTPVYTAEKACRDTVKIDVDFGHPLPKHVATHIIWGGAYATRSRTQVEEATTKFPVFAYHRIGPGCPEPLKQYSLAPGDFEQQLRYLRRRGFYSINPDHLYPQKYGAWRIGGRPLVLTFDDAYMDFFEIAWPILQRNGFTAHLFVPTGFVGKTAFWDRKYGAAAPLMDWNHIRRLSAEGVTFGSHLAGHRDSRKLSFTELLEEAVVSKKTLENFLGCPVNTVAPPYASYGPREVKILRTAGYHTIFGTQTNGSGATGQAVIPRFFVDGRKDLNAFSAFLSGMAPRPDDYDLQNHDYKTIH